MKRFQRICVFCGSQEGKKPGYRQAAEAMGQAMVEEKIDLVYGGGSIGLMGVIADSVLRGGGEVIGVIPEALDKREIKHPKLTEMRVVDTMHTRKAQMAGLSDAFIAMPGGFGTLDEFFEIVTWAQIGIHSKPIGLLNVGGFFAPLLAMVEHAIQEGFIQETFRDLFVSETEPKALLAALRGYRGSPSVIRLLKLEDV